MAYERDRQGRTDGRQQLGSVNAAKGGFSRKTRSAAVTAMNAQDIERLEREHGNEVRVAVDKRGNVKLAVYYREVK